MPLTGFEVEIPVFEENKTYGKVKVKSSRYRPEVA
jgi:hypothetical protein